MLCIWCIRDFKNSPSRQYKLHLVAAPGDDAVLDKSDGKDSLFNTSMSVAQCMSHRCAHVAHELSQASSTGPAHRRA
jgi:hypothetical protein